MVYVSAGELQRNWGKIQDQAIVGPVIVTCNGRERLVLVSIEEYGRLKRRDRKVMTLADFTDEDIAAIERMEPSPEAIALNHEMDKQPLSFPKPSFGQVIRYGYLWRAEEERGQEEGVKDRPCTVILATTDEEGEQIVTVLPITHTPPSDASLAVEIPHNVKKRLGLDDERSWVILTEANRFTWPGPDLRPGKPGEASSILYGELPAKLSKEIRDKFIAAYKAGKTNMVRRTE